jgi:tetratricopeptide (TPR) repeat protein
VLGTPGEALALMERVVALDPLSARTHRTMGLACFQAGRLDDAAAAFQLALDLSPNAGLSHAFLAIVRLLQGRADEGLSTARGESHDVFRNLAVALIEHASGNAAESDAALRTLSDGFGWTAAYQIAEAYAFRAEVDNAFEWLERAYAQRDPGVAHSAADPLLRPLHGDPRWRPFLQRLGLA